MARSAPSVSQTAHFSGVPAVAKTRTPSALASWIAVVPMPLAPPCTKMALAGGQAGAVEEVGPHGEDGLGQRRGGKHVEARGQRQDLGRGHGAISGVSAAGEKRTHGVAGPQGIDARAHAYDRPGDFETGDIRGAGRRRVMPAPLQEIGMVDPGRGGRDQHLAGRGRRPLGEAQNLGPAGPGDLDAGHGGWRRGRQFAHRSVARRLR